MAEINDTALDLLFRNARSQNGWQNKPVSEQQLRELYDLMKMGPTSANCSPLRIVFLTTPAAISRLLPAMSEGNQEKTRSAPVVAILAYDTEFYEKLPQLFPHNPDARNWFTGAAAETTAFRNSSLQAAYFMLAARAVGLDCGPMSGFDAVKVEAEFFEDGKHRVNFVCALGYGDPTKVMPRLPRLAFEEACRIEID
nr:malonic semialdehyde reductase [Pseudomonas sp.]